MLEGLGCQIGNLLFGSLGGWPKSKQILYQINAFRKVWGAKSEINFLEGGAGGLWLPPYPTPRPYTVTSSVRAGDVATLASNTGPGQSLLPHYPLVNTLINTVHMTDTFYKVSSCPSARFLSQ